MSHSITDSRKAPHRQPAVRPPLRAYAYILLPFLAVATASATAAPAYAVAPYSSKALAVAASKEGSPYARGATGPKRFDCSGLTLYAFRKAGRKLPRTAEQQYRQTRRIPSVHRALGDLVFFPRGSTVGHVGIYAGHNKIWHAPRPGTTVRLERIWTGNVRYGRAT
ncbi:C40 family peptidase [Streptomyces sp. NPDC003038]|uniref:C40 family peptidase n=1 Tax=Streptomyces sp. NPDC003038 TaxID=3154546 RepID=UPI0033BBF38F